MSGRFELLPETLDAVLSLRLEHLGMAKGVAQTASVIGWSFSLPLLRRVSGREELALDVGLTTVLRSGLVVQDGEEDFRFKHALVRDAAYASLAPDRRERLHRRVAEALEARDVAETAPELVALHYRRARMEDRAAAFSLRAGDRALGIAAYAEATAHLEAALSALEATPARAQAHAQLRHRVRQQLAAITPRPS